MNGSLLRKWLLVSLCSAWAVGVGCAGDPEKRTVYDADAGEGGEAGEPNDNVGGSNVPANNAGEPNAGGVAGAAGEPTTGGVVGAAGEGGTSAAGAPNLPQCEGELTFADPYVEMQVRMAISQPTGPITSAAVADLTTLAIPFNDDSIDMNGIECLTALTFLDFRDRGGGQPLSLLALLPNLRTIDFTDGYLSDLTGLGSVTQLTSLELGQNGITDFSELATLTNLENLSLYGNGDFNNTPLSIAAVASLTKLKRLDLGSLHIADVTPLASLSQLEELSISGTQLTALPDLSAHPELTRLNVSGNAIANLTPLGSLTKLVELNAASMGLTSLTAIAPLVALTKLDLSYNQLTNIAALGALPQLSVLDIGYNSGITSFQALVDSAYIGAGDELTVEGAGDCSVAIVDQLEALVADGVILHNACGVQ